MKLYVTYTSPYARLARIVVIEKELADTVSIVEAKTRIANSDYYKVNPSGRVPYLVMVLASKTVSLFVPTSTSSMANLCFIMRIIRSI